MKFIKKLKSLSKKGSNVTKEKRVSRIEKPNGKIHKEILLIVEKVLKEISKHDWEIHGRYNNVLLFSGHVKFFSKKDFVKEGISVEMKSFLKINNNHLLDANEMKDVVQSFYNKIKNDKSFLPNYIKKYYKEIDNQLKVSREIAPLNYKQKSNQELEKIYSEWIGLCNSLGHWLWSMESLNPAINQFVMEELSKEFPSKKQIALNEFLISASLIEKELPFQVEERELIELALKIKSEDALQSSDAFKKHVQKFAWLNMYILTGTPFNETHFTSRLLAKKNPQLELGQLEEKRLQSKNVLKKYEEALKGNQELLQLIRLIRELSYLKSYRIDAYTQSTYIVLGFLNEISRRLGLTYTELTGLLPEEVSKYLLANKRFDAKILLGRNKNGFLYTNNQMLFFSGDDVDRIERAVFKKDQDVTQLTGTIAIRGKVSGRAVCVETEKDLYKVQQGDILITHMTNPNYAPIFSKIKAIVTEEGGVLCHSAIIARELKIPCIISTKIALNVFEDGDVVEVDADAGIVRVIKRA